MSADAPLQIEQRGLARWLRLDRPERRNALDDALVQALSAAIADADADPATRAIVIAGNGPSFCAGADLGHLLDVATDEGTPLTFLEEVSALVTQLERTRTPTVAVLHGHVVAGGLELALGCDVRVAATSARIGDGHVTNGLLPAAGSSVRLPRAVGEGLARRLLLTGELLPADAFVPSGWIQTVVAPDELETEASRLVELLARPSPVAQGTMKSLLLELGELSPSAGLQVELQAFAGNWTAADVPTHLRRFLDRPDPVR